MDARIDICKRPGGTFSVDPTTGSWYGYLEWEGWWNRIQEVMNVSFTLSRRLSFLCHNIEITGLNGDHNINSSWCC